MNSENSKTSELHRLLLKLAGKISLNRSDAGKINLKRSDKYAALSNIKNIKKSYKNIKFKLLVPTKIVGTKILIYLTDHILYQIFKIFLNIS